MYDRLWNLLYPRCCPVCFQILDDQESDICPCCDKKVKKIKQPYCYQCGKPLSIKEQEYCYDCEKQEHFFLRGFSITEYDAATAPSVLAIKYKNRREFLEYYGRLGKEGYQNLFESLKLDCMIPVPITKRKRRKRGFNQAELFCKELQKWLSIPIYTSWLIRSKETAPLKELGPLERKKELQKAFVWNGKHYHGEQSVLLVDDIYTSGATVDACARILRQHGVKKVYVCTMAIGRGNDS